MNRAPFQTNGQLPAAASAPVRIVTVGWRGITIAAAVQIVVMAMGAQRFVDSIRSDVRGVSVRLDEIDRRLSKLDGVPR